MQTITLSPEQILLLQSIVSSQIYELNNDLNGGKLSDCAASVLNEHYELLETTLKALTPHE